MGMSDCQMTDWCWVLVAGNWVLVTEWKFSRLVNHPLLNVIPQESLHESGKMLKGALCYESGRKQVVKSVDV